MVALADKFHDAIEANALNKGAQRVAVLNMPAIDKTPRLQQVLGGITASAGAATSAQVQGLLKAWLEAFNAQLAKFCGQQQGGGGLLHLVQRPGGQPRTVRAYQRQEHRVPHHRPRC